MNLTFDSTPSSGVYVNNNYITIAESATLINVYLPVGQIFNTTPSLAGLGLSYVTGGSPEYITGDPIGAYGGPITISVGSPAESLNLEIIEPTFTITPNDSDTIYTVLDTLTANNPALVGRGNIQYFIEINQEWVFAGQTTRGGSIQISVADFDYGEFPIKAIYTVYDTVNGSTVEFTAEYEDTIEFVDLRPQLSLGYMSGTGCQGTCNQATIDQDVIVTPVFDTVVTVAEDATLIYELTDPNGDIIDTTTILIPQDDPTSVDSTYTFTPTEVGDYLLKATLTNSVGLSCISTIIVKGCDEFTITIDSCANYSIKNCSLTLDTILRITDFQGTQIVDDIALNAQTTTSFVVPNDGIYFAKIYDTDDNFLKAFLVIEYCNVLSCISSRIKSILCSCQSHGSARCKDYCASRYDMNRILPLSYLLFNYLNAEYSLNIIYTAIDNAKIVELSDINDVINTLNELCTDCANDLDGFEGSVTKSSPDSDCGCGCH